MKDFKDSYRELSILYTKIIELYESINVDLLKEKILVLEKERLTDNFWSDQERSKKVNRDISRLKKRIELWDNLISKISEALELMEMGLEENDNELLNDISEDIPGYINKFKDIETKELLSHEDDLNNAFITIHPGAGGTESQDWASMLYRMYSRWGEKNNYKIEIIDYTPGEEAGIKNITLLFKGDYAYGFLKSEMGVHRLVRISPFDANKKRHTSFASVEVLPELSDDIEVDINESDLRIDTYRSSGAGGQHVNTSDSAVRITHGPTGIVVQCQNERSQLKNKSSAMKVLKSRLYEFYKKQHKEKLQGKTAGKKEISWGNQIRSYVFQPYTMVKDHRTDEETGSIEYVFDGDINRFIYAYLKKIKSQK
jgi:peptide chain release factor 2